MSLIEFVQYHKNAIFHITGIFFLLVLIRIALSVSIQLINYILHWLKEKKNEAVSQESFLNHDNSENEINTEFDSLNLNNNNNQVVNKKLRSSGTRLNKKNYSVSKAEDLYNKVYPEILQYFEENK